MAGVLVGCDLRVASSKVTRSKYCPRAGRVFARARIRSEATPSARPGGSARAFCEPVNVKSRPQRSGSTGDPASDVTASTSKTTSSNSRAAAARASTSWSTPVEVSECTSVTASTGVRRRASRNMSASIAQPKGTSRRMHSLPHAPTMRAKRSLNAPFTSDRARRRTPFRTASSMNPVADAVPTRTEPEVRNRRASPGAIPANSCSIAPERWPIIGRCIAARTSGWTSVGPGRKKRPNAGSLMRSRARAPRRALPPRPLWSSRAARPLRPTP